MKVRLFVILIVFIVFAWSAQRWIDPDFGWHYRLGQIITTIGIPKTDPFSFTMPSYPFVDYEWFTNVLYFKTYELLGYQWLVTLHALAAITAPLLALSATKIKSKYLLIPLFLVLASFAGRFGVRPQVFSWLFMGLFIKIFYDEHNWNKLKWFFPPLMLVWANLHGSYPLAIGLAAILIILKSIKLKKIIHSDYLVLLAGIGATLINPYGIRNWHEVLNQMKLTGLYRQSVAEWQPALFTFDMGFFALFAFTLVLAWVNKKKVELWEVVLLVGGFLAGISSGRHAPLSVLLFSPLFIKYSFLLEQKIKKVPHGAKRLESFYTILAALVLITFVLQVWATNRTLSQFRETDFYPQKTVEFLRNYSKEPKRVFADYSIGGYLIWKLPNNKYFMDGRMPGFVYNEAPKGESNNAYLEYLAIMCGQASLSQGLDKYEVDLVIASKSTNSSVGNSLHQNVKELFFNAGLLYCKDNISILDEIKKLNWKQIYEDDKNTIFEST